MTSHRTASVSQGARFWDAVSDCIAVTRDAYPRLPEDAPSDECASNALAIALPFIASHLRQCAQEVARSEIKRPLVRDAAYPTDLASDFEWAAQMVEDLLDDELPAKADSTHTNKGATDA